MSEHSASEDSHAEDGKSGEYVVVARRYRPRTFVDLIGQGHVAQALSNAIATNRVGHAYLFTGARGVGKTSAARILAKALNCPEGPAAEFDNNSDICQSIDAGEDVDVLEIDGASNRGIDEIRQLRSNVNIRPSRSRYKIYIIDEVHMLTNQAFNALLKTLEEPPEHVKFIFCTTDPEKMPITVLSRCQRYDFAPIETAEIVGRLQFVVDNEGIQADPEALLLLARRANGSMRDSQSLLEQLLSFCREKISEDDVHAMLGTARGGRLSKLGGKLIERDAAAALTELDQAITEGVDAGQLGEQLIGYFRDMMGAVVGLNADMMRYSPSGAHAELVASGQQIGLENLLAIVQILDNSLTKMRHSSHARTLLEMAVVRICKLQDLEDISNLIAQVKAGAVAPTNRNVKPAATKAISPPQQQVAPTPTAQAPATPASPSAGPAPPAHAPSRPAQDSSRQAQDPGRQAPIASPSASMSSPSTASSPNGAATPGTAVSQGHSQTATAPNPPAVGQTPSSASTGAEPTNRRIDPPAPTAKPAESVAEAQLPSAEKKSDPTAPANGELAASSQKIQEINPARAESLWQQALDTIEDITADYGRAADSVAIRAPNRLVVSFRPEYTLHKDSCERPERRTRLEAALSSVAGSPVVCEFEMIAAQDKSNEPRKPTLNRVQRMREKEKHPMVKQAMEMFDAEILRVEEPRRQ